ncbi:MAG: DUF1285 domain-containing protein [Pseudomonadales bacterium]|nr:DUF1285 domain-containing protein [Pseudomonadales bacterium]
MQDELDKIFSKPTRRDYAGARKGRIDITIHSDGVWSYRGSPILRHEMVKLFASQLFFDEGNYYIRAPEQTLRISVEDLPFLVVSLDTLNDGANQQLLVRTNCDDQFKVDEAHPLKQLAKPAAGERRVASSSKASAASRTATVSSADSTTAPELLPAVLVRDGLYARFNRNSYYQLVDHAEVGALAGQEQQLFIRSCGVNFPLGSC